MTHLPPVGFEVSPASAASPRPARGRRHGRSHERPVTRLGSDSYCRPRQQRYDDPSLPGDRRETLLRVPPEETGPGHAAGGADEEQRQHAESRVPKTGSHHTRPERLDGVAAWKEGRDMLRPLRQALQRHRHAADDQHRQEDALAERLNGRHVVGHRRNDEAQADEARTTRTLNATKRSNGCRRHRHADRHRQRQLQQSRRQQEQIARDERAGDDAGSRDRREAIAPPDAALAIAHDGVGRPKQAPPRMVTVSSSPMCRTSGGVS